MVKKLLIICGPTATGKTTLGIKIAKKLGGEIISADSRQVYKDMDIGTGKDLPQDAKFEKVSEKTGGYYELHGVKIWGYDLVSPRENFSVADYVPIAREILEMIWDKKGLPIVVGGTGLYVQGVTDGIGTASIPRDSGLREKLEEREVDELYEQLAQLDPIKAASLNTSDKKNPRRLIRAIEVAQWGVKGKKKRRRIGTEPLKKVETLFVGLKGEREKLCKRVEKRVNQRLEAGIKGEIEKLLDSGVSWDSQAMISLGYKHWRGYFEKDEKQEDVLKKWKNDECQYAKRQMTWFKKDKRVVWYDIFSDEYPDSVEKSVKKWYKER